MRKQLSRTSRAVNGRAILTLVLVALIIVVLAVVCKKLWSRGEQFLDFTNAENRCGPERAYQTPWMHNKKLNLIDNSEKACFFNYVNPLKTNDVVVRNASMIKWKATQGTDCKEEALQNKLEALTKYADFVSNKKDKFEAYKKDETLKILSPLQEAEQNAKVKLDEAKTEAVNAIMEGNAISQKMEEENATISESETMLATLNSQQQGNQQQGNQQSNTQRARLEEAIENSRATLQTLETHKTTNQENVATTAEKEAEEQSVYDKAKLRYDIMQEVCCRRNYSTESDCSAWSSTNTA